MTAGNATRLPVGAVFNRSEPPPPRRPGVLRPASTHRPPPFLGQATRSDVIRDIWVIKAAFGLLHLTSQLQLLVSILTPHLSTLSSQITRQDAHPHCYACWEAGRQGRVRPPLSFAPPLLPLPGRDVLSSLSCSPPLSRTPSCPIPLSSLRRAPTRCARGRALTPATASCSSHGPPTHLPRNRPSRP